MKYLHIKTNNLVDLIGRNNKDKIDWESVGTNVKLINLNTYSISQTNVDNVNCYLLPIIDEVKAQAFIDGECATYGIVAELLTEENAILHYNELKLYREILKDELATIV